MTFLTHPQSLCESTHIGENTRIWAFVHILPSAIIGKNCNICDHVLIENDVIIGDNVTIKSGVQLWDGVRIEDNVFIGPNATFTNDKFPRSKVYPEKFLSIIIKKNASIGANATLLPNIIIGENAMIGAGSVVVKSVPDHAIVMGNPARITGYMNNTVNNSHENIKYAVNNIQLQHFKIIHDLRGSLSVGEFMQEVPFVPKRYFLVFDVDNAKIRGEHAHKKCHQFLICVKGSCKVLVDDGKNRAELMLNKPNVGLYLPPMIWGTQHEYTKDAVLLVFASEHYDPDDYIRDYQLFVQNIQVAQQ